MLTFTCAIQKRTILASYIDNQSIDWSSNDIEKGKQMIGGKNSNIIIVRLQNLLRVYYLDKMISLIHKVNF